VAEGVETFEELAYLKTASRIRQAQGFYFSKPFFLEEAASAKRVHFSGQALGGETSSGRIHGGRQAEAARAPADARGAHAARAATAARLRRD
jgi:hypothetical protein